MIDQSIYVTCMVYHQTSNWCIMCKNNNETSYHMFLNCPSALSLWNNIKARTGWTNNFNCLRDLCKHICSINTKSQTGVIHYNLLVSTIWVTWLKRNTRRLFNNSHLTSISLWENICNLTGLWSSNNKLLKNYSPSSIALNINVFFC